ncbi:hypothetical protein F4804DRAFT_299643 [Jackrogersella minutella]|nr:hypothetical protein F4804DRAFT_299643 [Jackrogersella minutella]
MDPFSAIGLAGNVITFIDFGYKLLSTAKAIYTSTSGTSSLNEELESAARQLQGVVSGLITPSLLGSTTEGESVLYQLATECSSISSDLIQLVADLKTKSLKSKRASLRAAFRDLTKKDERDGLQLKLDRCRDQLTLQITMLMRSESLDQLNRLIAHGQASSDELRSLTKNIESLRSSCNVSCLNPEILNWIHSLLGLTEEAVAKIRQARVLDGLRFELIDERFEDIEEAHERTFQWILSVPLNSQLISQPEVEPEESNEVNEVSSCMEAISTESLLDYDEQSSEDGYFSNRDNHYHDINAFRQGSVPKDYDGSSFEWSTGTPEPYDDGTSKHESDISDGESSTGPPSLLGQTSSMSIEQSPEPPEPAMAEARDLFVTWLQQGDGIFHIVGKPGSGKSTMMKFVCRQPKTEEHLQVWAGNAELVIGKFFFWRPGSPLQKSLKGLIRGLLSCLLAKSPGLIPLAFPDQWQASTYRRNIHIEHHECQLGFERLVSSCSFFEEHKFVFFIDGLDEFDGDHATLIRKLFQWTNNTQGVKICVSSREWTMFQEGFRGCPKLWLHDLTRLDIRRVVRDRLREMKLPYLLNHKSSPFSKDSIILEDEIVRGSDGVFLWVVLVLRHIENGLINGDQMEDLMKVVRSLPTDFEPMLYQLLTSIPSVNRKLAYAILSVALFNNKHCIGAPLTLIRFSLLEDYVKDADFAMGQGVRIFSSAETTQRLDRARKRIYGVCKGFLELRPNPIRTRSMRRDAKVSNVLGDVVSLTHRSIVEFLESQLFQQMAWVELQDFDPLDAVVQTYLGVLKCINLPRFYFAPKFGTTTTLKYSRIWKVSPLYWRSLNPPLLSFITDIHFQINLYTDLASERDPRRFFHFLDEIRRTIIALQMKPAALALGSPIDDDKVFYCPMADLPFLISTCLGFFEYVPDQDVSSHLVIDCINICLRHFTYRGVHFSFTRLSIVPRLFKTLSALLSKGFSLDHAYGPEGLSMSDFIFTTSCFYGMPHLQLVAFMLYNGANPRFAMVLSKNRYRCGTRIAHKAYFTMELPGTGRGNAGDTIRIRPRGFLREERVMVCSGTGLDRIIAKHGLTLSLRTLVLIWFPEHAAVLQEVIDWVLGVGVPIDANRRLELQSKFDLRRFFDEEHPDFVGWASTPSDDCDIMMEHVTRYT